MARSIELARAALGGDPALLAAYHERVRAMFHDDRSLGTHLGVEVLELAVGHVTMRMAYRQELLRGGGIFHGGAIMALADHVAGCVFNADPRPVAEGMTAVTTDFHASFLRAAERGEALVARGEATRRGRTVTFIEIRVTGERTGKEIAVARATYVTVPREKLTAR